MPNEEEENWDEGDEEDDEEGPWEDDEDDWDDDDDLDEEDDNEPVTPSTLFSFQPFQHKDGEWKIAVQVSHTNADGEWVSIITSLDKLGAETIIEHLRDAIDQCKSSAT